jgi:hypothetical protein
MNEIMFKPIYKGIGKTLKHAEIKNNRLDRNALIKNIYNAIGETEYDDAQSWYNNMMAEVEKYDNLHGRAPEDVKKFKEVKKAVKAMDDFKIKEDYRNYYYQIFKGIFNNEQWNDAVPLKTFKKFAPIIQIKYGGSRLESITNYNKLANARHEKNERIREEREKGKAREQEAIAKGEENLRKLKMEENEKLNARLAAQANKRKDEVDELEALREENEKLKQNQFQPSMREYIKNKVRDGSYKLDKDDLHVMLSKDKNKGLITDENIDDVVKAIYLEGNKHVIKNKRRIAQLARLQGYNPNEYAKLPVETQQEVNDYIVEKFNDDLRKKNLKYILPKDKPRWQRAQVLFKLNPNLGKGAWSH